MKQQQTHKQDQTLIEQYSSATVVGLGATGFSVARYLHAQGLAVSVVDSREKPALAKTLQENYKDIQASFGSLTSPMLENAELLIVSPGVALSEPALKQARDNGAYIAGDIDLFVEANTRPIIAITGSNGKSTVVTLVGEMCCAGGLKPLVAGNIGLPVLDALAEFPDYEIAVLELSSFQLETMHKLNADSAAILNVSEDHMDRYSSMGDYMLAKAKILRGAKNVVMPRHDEQLKQITLTGSEVLSFDLDEPRAREYGVTRKSNYRWLSKGEERLIKLRDVPLTGMHNINNVLAAYALIDFLNLNREKVKQAILNFKDLPHRMQTIAALNDVVWVNDSKATNVGATSKALISLEKDVIWIAGGLGKGADFSDLRAAIGSNIKELILLGADADKIEAALSGLLPINRVANMQEAVELANLKAVKDTIVLLSPACASMDMYKSFEHRGDDYVEKVNAILNCEDNDQDRRKAS